MRAALVLGAHRREPAHVLQPPRERVALALELGEAEQARAADGDPCDSRGADGDVRERRGDELRQLALEPRDLIAQRTARGALVQRLAWRCCAIDHHLLVAAHASDSSCRTPDAPILPARTRPNARSADAHRSASVDAA